MPLPSILENRVNSVNQTTSIPTCWSLWAWSLSCGKYVGAIVVRSCCSTWTICWRNCWTSSWYWSTWAMAASNWAICSLITMLSSSSSWIISSADSVTFESLRMPERKCSWKHYIRSQHHALSPTSRLTCNFSTDKEIFVFWMCTSASIFSRRPCWSLSGFFLFCWDSSAVFDFSIQILTSLIFFSHCSHSSEVSCNNPCWKIQKNWKVELQLLPV